MDTANQDQNIVSDNNSKGQSFSFVQKVTMAVSGFFVLTVLICSSVILANFNSTPSDVSAVSPTSNAGIAQVDNTGFVQGAFDEITITPTTIVPNKRTLGTFKKGQPINLSGSVPTLCLNTDGNFCQANISKAANCANGVCAATSLTFTVTPDVDGHWAYSVPTGLDPGDYQVTIKNPSGTILEVITFTIANSTTNTTGKDTGLPNTGLIEDIFFPLITVSLVLVISLTVMKFAKGKAKRIE